MSLPTLPTALHLGALHPAEQVLVYLLAFGPFVLLGLLVVARRRRDRQDHGDHRGDRPAAAPARDQRDR